jgi:hypothetical protein
MAEESEAGTPREPSFEQFFETENRAEHAPAQPAEKAPLETPAPPEDTPEKEPIAAKDGDKGDRNLDGTFKPKDGNRRKDPQAKIDYQTRLQREAERRAEVAERRIQELEAAIRQPQARPQAPIAPVAAETPQEAWKRYMAQPGAPQRASFEDPTEYAIAANYFISEQRDAERQQREQHVLNQHLDAQRASAFHERGIAKDPKFFENLQARTMAEGDPPINLPTQDYIKASPLGPDLLVYLLDNPAEAQRLSTLPPLQSREAIAEIAGSFKARQTAASQAPRQTPVLSRAPAPIQPLGGSLTPADSDDADIPFEEFVRRENKAQQRR